MIDSSTILITIDVEDWFQVENFKEWIPYSSWSDKELRVERNVHKILDLFELLGSSNHEKENLESPSLELKATFFVLGWIAKRLPHLVKEIRNRGHEVASHGYQHKLNTAQPYPELKKDLTNSKKLLEDIIGQAVLGYRAPSFSISDETLKVIEDCGYLYDTSYNSFRLNERYGQITLPENESQGLAIKLSKGFYEIPISNLNFHNYMIPWGGGGYFRLIPLYLFKMGVKRICNLNGGYMFYLHPWEVDPNQPKVKQASRLFRFRHYLNLATTEMKLKRLIKSFSRYRIESCAQYLKRNVNLKADHIFSNN